MYQKKIYAMSLNFSNIRRKNVNHPNLFFCSVFHIITRVSEKLKCSESDSCENVRISFWYPFSNKNRAGLSKATLTVFSQKMILLCTHPLNRNHTSKIVPRMTPSAFFLCDQTPMKYVKFEIRDLALFSHLMLISVTFDWYFKAKIHESNYD